MTAPPPLLSQSKQPWKRRRKKEISSAAQLAGSELLEAGAIRSKEGIVEGVLPPADEVNRWSQELNEMSGELAQSQER